MRDTARLSAIHILSNIRKGLDMHTENKDVVTRIIYRQRAEAAERAAEAAVDVEVRRMLIAATQRWRQMAGIAQRNLDNTEGCPGGH